MVLLNGCGFVNFITRDLRDITRDLRDITRDLRKMLVIILNVVACREVGGLRASHRICREQDVDGSLGCWKGMGSGVRDEACRDEAEEDDELARVECVVKEAELASNVTCAS